MRSFEELKADIEAGRSVLIGDEKVTEVARLEVIYADGEPEDKPVGTLNGNKYAVQSPVLEAQAVDNTPLIEALNTAGEKFAAPVQLNADDLVAKLEAHTEALTANTESNTAVTAATNRLADILEAQAKAKPGPKPKAEEKPEPPVEPTKQDGE